MNDRLEYEDRSKPTPFNGWNKINRAKKHFSDNAKIKRAGKEISLQEYINENNKDCTIYDVYNTYRGDKKLTVQALNTLSHKVSDELMQVTNLQDAFAVMKKAEESWRALPLDIRKEFGNNVREFQKNGLQWAQKKYKETYDKLHADDSYKVEQTKQPSVKVEAE